MITISDAHNAARLAGTRTFIDTGSNPAQLAFYASTRVAITASPSSSPVSTIPLANPSGVIDGSGFHLAQADDGFNTGTGTVQWARLFSRDGSVVADFDVRETSDDPLLGEIAILSTTLYAGGITRLVSAVLT